jgi:hypothetical protein
MQSWKLAVTLAAILVVVLFASPRVAAAQEPVRDFSQLNTRLKPGDTVWVTDAQGREVKGKIRELGPSALTLDGTGTGTIAADAVCLITARHGRPIGKGALWGLAAGAVFGAVAVVADDGCESDCGSDAGWMLVGAGLFGAIGAGAGAVVGALIPGKSLVVFRAPGAAGHAQARLSIAPVIAPRVKGVAVSFAF